MLTMIKQHWLLVAAIAAAPLVAAPVAGATPVKAGAAIVGPVRVDPADPSVAAVTARYICQPGAEDQWLWVSAKQTGEGRPDPALRDEASSQAAAAWIQAHPLGEFTCDGAWHTDTFRISTDFDPVNGGGFGELQTGQVWVQFCLFDGQGNFVSESRWAEAR
jgi:hypothetical protein